MLGLGKQIQSMTHKSVQFSGLMVLACILLIVNLLIVCIVEFLAKEREKLGA